jgi:hypothetical protein
MQETLDCGSVPKGVTSARGVDKALGSIEDRCAPYSCSDRGWVEYEPWAFVDDLGQSAATRSISHSCQFMCLHWKRLCVLNSPYGQGTHCVCV